MNKITSFRGPYSFLSNFYTCKVYYEGITYRSVEAAFQAAKTLDINTRLKFVNLSALEAKKLGHSIPLRSDWEQVKDEIMEELVRNKFMRNERLRKKLLETGDAELIEGNYWDDMYWGVCNGKGQNKLGKILMKIREELKEVLE
ncbi:NADAR family protein [Thermosipho sp. (in: thermotogales)]|jgi:hypothetical protein|uniref:NADAR family protein n=1 Tax=Thermosipho sp. (in: thermotogales) TaxID=1968895 RepID=UPI00257DF0B1|nr:NADAR family protein [Thermosipho sp. (in: thermotogales)]MBZ4649256.1 hypothetical protein [Thermosipho sp. (in: thermotogales)]